MSSTTTHNNNNGVRKRSKRKSLRNGHDRKRLLRSDEPVFNVETVSAQMENLLKEQRLSDSQLDSHIHDVKRDAIASIILHADARIGVDLSIVFPEEVFESGPMNHLVDRDSSDGHCMRYLDVMVIAAYSHCVRKYGRAFTGMAIIYKTFHDMMSMSWEESTEVDVNPSVINMKRLFFFTVLTIEKGFQNAVANDYQTVESLARYTRFVDTLRQHTELLFQTPFSSHKATTNNHVGIVLNNYIHHIMQESILAIQ